MSADRAAQWTRRRAGLVQGFDGTWSLFGTLDPESGAIVDRAWGAISDELRRADAADSAAPERNPAQRSVDALVEMVRRAAATDPSRSRPARPEMVVVVDHDTLVAGTGGDAQLVDGTVLAGDAARRLACDAAMLRAVVVGTSEILDLGRATPTPNTAQRRALELRDGGCVWPGCDRPPGWCDAHHLIPYQRGSPHGGPTDLDHLGLLCRRHHHLVHDDGYTIIRDPATGTVTVGRPDGTHIADAVPIGPLGRRRTTSHPEPPHRTRTRRSQRRRLDQEERAIRRRCEELIAVRLRTMADT